MKKLIAVTFLGSMSACSGVVAGSSGDSLTLHGTPEAIRAFGDYQTGLINVGKAEIGATDTPYHELRRFKEREDTIREVNGGSWLSKWVMSKGKKDGNN